MSRRLRLKRNELELPALLAVHGTDEPGEFDGATAPAACCDAPRIRSRSLYDPSLAAPMA